MSSLIRVPFGILLLWKSSFRYVWWDVLIHIGTRHLLQGHQLLDALQRFTCIRGLVQHTSSDGLKWASRHTGAKKCPQFFGLMILSRYLGPCFILHHSTILLYCLQHLHNCHYNTVTHEMAAVQMQCQPQRVPEPFSEPQRDWNKVLWWQDDRVRLPSLTSAEPGPIRRHWNAWESLHWLTSTVPFAFESKEKSSVAFQRWRSLAASANMFFHRTMKVHSVPYLQTHICVTGLTLLNRFDDLEWL